MAVDTAVAYFRAAATQQRSGEGAPAEVNRTAGRSRHRALAVVATALELMAEIVQERTQPGPAIELPKSWPANDAASVARGRELYTKASCAACHGETGRGDGIQVQKDEMEMPIRPRDYTQGIFKGGRDRESLFARIALGVPGTPMPSTPALSPEETADLVIDAVVEPEELRQEVVRRFRYAARRDRHFSTRHRAIPPV